MILREGRNAQYTIGTIFPTFWCGSSRAPRLHDAIPTPTRREVDSRVKPRGGPLQVAQAGMDSVLKTALTVIVPAVCIYERCILNSPLATEAYHSAERQVKSALFFAET